MQPDIAATGCWALPGRGSFTGRALGLALLLALLSMVYAVVDECEPVSGGTAFQGIFRYINEELKSPNWREYISHCTHADPKCKAPACALHCKYTPIGYRRRAPAAGSFTVLPPAPPLKYTCQDGDKTLVAGQLVTVFNDPMSQQAFVNKLPG